MIVRAAAIVVLMTACAAVGAVLGARGNDARDARRDLVGRQNTGESILVSGQSIGVELRGEHEVVAGKDSLEPTGLEPFMLRAEDLPERFRPYFVVQGMEVGQGFMSGAEAGATAWVIDYQRQLSSLNDEFEDVQTIDPDGGVTELDTRSGGTFEPTPPYDYTSSVMVMLMRFTDAEAARAALDEMTQFSSQREGDGGTIVLKGADETVEEVLERWGEPVTIDLDRSEVGDAGIAAFYAVPRLQDDAVEPRPVVYWQSAESWIYVRGRYLVFLMGMSYTSAATAPTDLDVGALARLMDERLQTAP